VLPRHVDARRAGAASITSAAGTGGARLGREQVDRCREFVEPVTHRHRTAIDQVVDEQLADAGQQGGVFARRLQVQIAYAASSVRAGRSR
jgi:hypothetical protein